MKITLTALIILASVTCLSQELKKISVKAKNSSAIEEYFVLKKDKDIKHGMYKKISEKGIILEKGFYKNNQRDSLWVFFLHNGIDTASYGFFTDDKRIGPWVINDNKGILMYIYDYSSGMVSNYNWNDESNKFLVLRDNKWVEEKIDSPPLVIDGDKPLSVIARNLQYPTRAWRSGIEGQVFISFTVDSTGRMGIPKIKDGVDPDLDAEALRLVKLLETIWYPAMKNEKPLTIEYFLPVKFTLKK
jgi:TonB family protein